MTENKYCNGNCAGCQHSEEELEDKALRLIEEKETVSFNGFIRSLGCCSQNLNSALNKLAKKGLIEERS